MKKTLKKHGLALACAASLCSAMALPAFAETVPSPEDPVDELVTYLQENGVSEEDIADIVDLYIAGSAQASATKLDVPYYNANSLASTQHYVIAITPDTASFPTGATIDVYAKLQTELVPTQAKVITDYDYFAYTNTVLAHIGSDPGAEPYNKSSFMLVTQNKKLSSNGLFTVPINITSSANIKSEAALNKQVEIFSNSEKRDVVFETYALGDVNHDGLVDAADVTYLSNFLLGKENNFEFTYSDYSTHYAGLTNIYASDVNTDDQISLADLIVLKSIVKGQ